MKNRNRNGQGAKPRQQQPCRAEIHVLAAQETVNIPLDQYDQLLRDAALVDVLRQLVLNGHKYAASELLENLFQDEKEAK